MSTRIQLEKELKKQGNKRQALAYLRFFKTGRGEYGEGDKFLGLKVPKQKVLAKKYQTLSLPEIEKLLQSKIHEHRLTALFILRHQFEKAAKEKNEIVQKKIIAIYLKHAAQWVNNWDLVDSSAHYLLGAYLWNKPRKILYTLAKSKNLWERRIAIMSTFCFIKKDDFVDALGIAEILLKDQHDLIQKAVGWMLREVGKCDHQKEVVFLKKYYLTMPRTMLRYAVEKFSKSEKSLYLLGKN